MMKLWYAVTFVAVCLIFALYFVINNTIYVNVYDISRFEDKSWLTRPVEVVAAE